jgi:hypothetical protein
MRATVLFQQQKRSGGMNRASAAAAAAVYSRIALGIAIGGFAPYSPL